MKQRWVFCFEASVGALSKIAAKKAVGTLRKPPRRFPEEEVSGRRVLGGSAESEAGP